MKNLVASLFAPGLVQVASAARANLVIDACKRPACGCRSKWIDHLEPNGFVVRSHDTDNLAQHIPGFGPYARTNGTPTGWSCRPIQSVRQPWKQAGTWAPM